MRGWDRWMEQEEEGGVGMSSGFVLRGRGLEGR